MRLTDNTLLITGGATGIGLELAKSLLARGNTVLVCGRTQANLDEARALYPSLKTYRCDVSDQQQRREMLAAIASDGYQINVLVNNAAILSTFDLANTDVNAMEGILRDIAVNLVAPIELIHELLPTLKQQADAAIINFNSPAGVVPVTRTPIYSATKAGLYSYSKNLRHHLRDDSVQVIDIFPPGVDTPMTAKSGRKQISAVDYVEKLLAQLEQNREEIWIGEARFIRWLGRLMPDTLFKLVARQLPVRKSV